MTQPSEDQTSIPGRPEASGSVPAEAAVALAPDGWADLGRDIWERYGSSPGLVSMSVSRDLDARWSNWSGSRRLPLLAGLMQRWAAPETGGHPDRRELPLVWPGGPGQPADPVWPSTSGTPQARQAAPPGVSKVYPLAPSPAHDSQPQRLAGAPTGPVQGQVRPAAGRRPGNTTAGTTDSGRPRSGAQGNSPGSPEAGPDAAPAAAPAGLSAPGPAPAQRQSNLGMDILARRTGLPLVSRAGTSGAGSPGQTPVDEGPGASQRSGGPVSTIGPANPALSPTRATGEGRTGARTTENPPNPPLPRGSQEVPHMPEEELESFPLVKVRAENTPVLKGDSGGFPSSTMPGRAGGERSNLSVLPRYSQEPAANPVLPAGAGAYGLGLSIVQRYGGAPSVQQSPSPAGPALPLASAIGPNAEEYAAGLTRRAVQPHRPRQAGSVSGSSPLPGPAGVTRETTAAAAPLVGPNTRMGREILSQNRGLARSHPLIHGDMADPGRSRAETPPITPPAAGAISPRSPEDAGTVRDWPSGVGAAPQERLGPGYLEPLPQVQGSPGPLPAAPHPATPAGPAATLPLAARAPTVSSSLAAGALARAPLPAGGDNSYVNQRVADSTLIGRSESPQPVAMPLARQWAQNGPAAAGGMGVPTAGAGGATRSRSAPGLSAPTRSRPATPQAGVIARESAPGSPPPAAPAGSAQQTGSEGGEADLERLADRVYTIIQRRLILERESLGI